MKYNNVQEHEVFCMLANFSIYLDNNFSIACCHLHINLAVHLLNLPAVRLILVVIDEL